MWGVVFVEENFAFAKLDVFLKIEGHLVGGAEILHVFWKFKSEFLNQTEEVVDGGFAGEDHGIVFRNADMGFAELTGGDSFNTEEFEKIDVDTVLFG